MKAVFLVGIGGGLGSILRYLTSIYVSKHFPSAFPWGTLTVNILVCFLIGILIGILDRQQIVNSDLKLLLITGFCGGYSTFSAFAVENFSLLQNGNTLLAFLYIAASIIIGILAVWMGSILSKMIHL